MRLFAIPFAFIFPVTVILAITIAIIFASSTDSRPFAIDTRQQLIVIR